MVRRARLAAVAMATLLAVGATTACQPPPPRLVLSVTTTANGADDSPGDGTCSSATAGGCSLQAAFEEANVAAHGADVVVPAGSYRDFDPTITGDVRVNPGALQQVTLSRMVITVASGGHLELNGINTGPFPDAKLVRLLVDGSVVLWRSAIHSLDVGPGGGAVLLTSAVLAVGWGDPFTAVANRGRVLAVSSSLLAHDTATGGLPLSGGAGSATHLVGSVLARPDLDYWGGTLFPGGGGTCVGDPPISHGFVFVEVPCGSAPATGDASGLAGVNDLASISYEGEVTYSLNLGGSSPLVDAIPLGDPACDTSVVDLYGTPRGVDGNGDGVGGCDIGAVERP